MDPSIYISINVSIYRIIYLFRKENASHKGQEDVLGLHVVYHYHYLCTHLSIYLYNLSIYLIIYLFRKVNAKHKGREDVLDLYVDLSMDLSLYISVVSIYLIIYLFREEIRTLPSTRARRMSWTCPQAVSRLFTHSFYFHLFIYMLT